MARLELNITGIGIIELGDETNSPLRLDKRLSDISVLTKRSDMYSYTFNIPDTNNNKRTLQYYYHSRYNNYGNIDEEKECFILVDGGTFAKGKVRIKSSSITDDIRTYTVQFSGGNIDWWSELRKYTLADLDWSGSTGLVYNETNIVASWTNTYVDAFVYALIDRGNTTESFDAILTTSFRPELFVRFIIDEIAVLLGITFSSNFFDEAGFKKLTIPYFNKTYFGLRDDVVTANSAIIEQTTDSPLTSLAPNVTQTIGVTGGEGLGVPPLFTDISDGEGIVGSDGTITTLVDGASYILKMNLKVDVWAASGNDVELTFWSNVGWQPNSVITISGSTTINPTDVYVEIPLNNTQASASYFIYYQAKEIASFPKSGVNHKILTGTTINFEGVVSSSNDGWIAPIIHDGWVYNLGDVIDADTSLFDIFNDIARAFNLYAETDNITNVVSIESRKSFYSPIASAEDITGRLDLKREIITTFNSELYTRYLNFDYDDDSLDVYLSEINSNKENNYMSYEHDYGAKFKEGAVSIKMKVLSASLIRPYWDCTLDNNDPSIPPLTSRYWKEKSSSSPGFLELKKPKLLNYVYATQTADATGVNRTFRIKTPGHTIFVPGFPSLGIPDETIVVDPTFNTYTTIPAAVPQSTEGVTAPYNLAFDGPDGLVATHYDDVIDMIETGIREEIYMYWDKEKYINAKFRIPKHISSPEYIKGYYIIESIEGYDPLVPGVYKTILLRVIPTSGKTFGTQNPGDLVDFLIANAGDFNGSATKNSIANGSVGVGEGLIASSEGSIIRGKFNEDAPGALEVVGNGTLNSRSNLYIITAKGTKIENPEIMIVGDKIEKVSEVYYESDDKGNLKYVY